MKHQKLVPVSDECRRACEVRGWEVPPGSPPPTLNVLDGHGGFTVETSGRNIGTGTLWRPGDVLKKGTIGKLENYDGKSFYQTNKNVTRARYKVPGYRYMVCVWFDNQTGERIA